MTVIHRRHCEKCNGVFRISEMTAIVLLVSPQTRSEPAEYEDAFMCDPCAAEDERDPDYERATLRFRETHGGEL